MRDWTTALPSLLVGFEPNVLLPRRIWYDNRDPGAR